MNLVDTAGLRTTSDDIEIQGVQRAESYAAMADIILFVFDINNEYKEVDKKLINKLIKKYKTNYIFIGNKIDLGRNNMTIARINELNVPLILISAQKEIGLERVKLQIKKIVEKEYEKTAEEPVISNIRHKNLLDKTKIYLQKALRCLSEATGFEFAALDLREALNSLSEITGETVTDDILNHIFSNFCIGK